MAALRVEVRRVNGKPVLDLVGEVDSYNAPRLKEAVIALVNDGAPELVINMGGVVYIDSTGLGTFVGVFKWAAEKNSAIRLACMSDEIHKVFHITGLVKLFPIFNSEAEACAPSRGPRSFGPQTEAW